jgi:hypothetical protein
MRQPSEARAPARSGNGDANRVSRSTRRRWAIGGNCYDHVELAGAFGDLGTLIPFVVGYIATNQLDPLGFW